MIHDYHSDCDYFVLFVQTRRIDCFLHNKYRKMSKFSTFLGGTREINFYNIKHDNMFLANNVLITC